MLSRRHAITTSSDSLLTSLPLTSWQSISQVLVSNQGKNEDVQARSMPRRSPPGSVFAATSALGIHIMFDLVSGDCTCAAIGVSSLTAAKREGANMCAAPRRWHPARAPALISARSAEQRVCCASASGRRCALAGLCRADHQQSEQAGRRARQARSRQGLMTLAKRVIRLGELRPANWGLSVWRVGRGCRC